MIGLPGERIRIEPGRVLVDGEPLAQASAIAGQDAEPVTGRLIDLESLDEERRLTMNRTGTLSIAVILLLVVLVGWLGARTIIKPLEIMLAAWRQLAQGVNAGAGDDLAP